MKAPQEKLTAFAMLRLLVPEADLEELKEMDEALGDYLEIVLRVFEMKESELASDSLTAPMTDGILSEHNDVQNI